MDNLIKGTKEDSLNIRRLQKMTGNRPGWKNLKGVWVDGPHLWACDGFVATAIPTPEGLSEQDGRIIDANLSAGEFIAEAEEIEGQYPDVYGIRPTTKVAAEITVNAKYLLRIAELAGKQPVRLVIYEGPPKGQPMEIRSANADPQSNTGNTPVFALIMPMQVDRENDYIPAANEDEADEGEVRQAA